MNRNAERGVALILTLILLAVLSVMAVSFMFLSQSETWSTMNYRLTSQARDAAEAGLNSATNYIVNTYTGPVTGAGCATDVIGCYTLTSLPVKVVANGNPVVLSGNAAVTSNYPIAAVQTAFNTTGVGFGTITATVGAITTTANYATSATLLSMRQITVYGGAVSTVQTWQIVSDGTISNGVRNAKEELSVTLEKPILPMFNFAAFAASNQCSALTFSQPNTSTDSYDSSLPGQPAGILASDGNVGTNGNLNSSTAQINGILASPAVGTGVCANGAGGATTAETAAGGNVATGGLVELPQPITYPTPVIPGCPAANCMPPLTNQSLGTSCSPIPASGCTDLASKKVRLLPGNFGNLSIGSSMTDVHLIPGTYNINSFTSGNVNLIIDGPGPTILNVGGCATLNANSSACATNLASPIDFSSSGVSNPTYVALNFQIQYGGPGAVNVKCGNTGVAAVLYAPNAAVTLSANGSFYGAVIGNTVTVSSGANLNYDRNLQDSGYNVGNFALGGFSWAKF